MSSSAATCARAWRPRLATSCTWCVLFPRTPAHRRLTPHPARVRSDAPAQAENVVHTFAPGAGDGVTVFGAYNCPQEEIVPTVVEEAGGAGAGAEGK